MFKDELAKFVVENPKLVSMRPAGEDIYVLKYKKSVFFDDLWNDYIEHCRGTIVDSDFNIVSYPFTKIYNYGIEARAPKLEDSVRVTAYRKVNGFMVACTWYKDDVLVSTTGSTDSPYVDMAKEMIGVNLDRYRKVCKEYEGHTFMFECCHVNDPHIVVEAPGMYLLGFRKNEYGSPIEANAGILMIMQNMFRTNIVSSSYTTLGQLKEEVRKVQHEGFVFYTEDGISSKIKSPYYLTSKWVARNPRTDKLVDLKNDIKKNLDEEYYPLVDAIRANIVEYTAMDEQGRLAWVRNYMEAA